MRAIYVALISSLLSIFIFSLGGSLQYLENKSYDRRMKNSATFFTPSDDIVFIAVDQRSLDWVYENKGYSWPWPIKVYADIINFLSKGEVNSIMFDMLYTEPSSYGKEDDKAFSDAQKESGRVINTVFKQDNGKVLFPIKELKDTSALLANVNSVMDNDDVIRKYKPFYNIDGINYPSVGMAPLVLENLKNEEKFEFPPMDKKGAVRLRFLKSINEYFPYSAADILESVYLYEEGKESFYVPEDFDGKYVFFGLYAPGLFDICSTPVSQVYPGIGTHITALDNYLQENYIYDVPLVVNYIWFLLVSLLASFLVATGERRKTQSRIVIFLLISFILGAIVVFELPFILFIFGININQTGPLISYIISFFLMFVVIYMMEGKQKRFIKYAFSQCLSKDVVNDIINDPSSFTLGGKKFVMSALFSDIEKFSSISEILSASQLGKLLNYYLTRMSDVIIDEKGTIDKYEGDAIVAMVGAPVKMEDHAIRACNAAIKMKKEELLMNKQIKALVEKNSLIEASKAGIDSELFEAFKILVKNDKKFFTRIGINSGEMIAGYFGSTLKKNYTIMGNNVNLAARLEGVNKQYKTSILISEYTKNLIGDSFILRRLDRVQVVNVNAPITLYELLDNKENSRSETVAYVNNWEKAMTLFDNEKYEEALTCFKELQEKNKEDRTCSYYISLLEDFFTKGKYPTDSDNIGVSYNKELNVFKLLQK